jgi:hypothetical protein
MTPQDTCENVRNIVFEILRRRYPETMPTKGIYKEDFAIYSREEYVAKFYRQYTGPANLDSGAVKSPISIVCSHRKSIGFRQDCIYIGSVQNGTVCEGLVRFGVVHKVVADISSSCAEDIYNQIADEFGMGVER